MGCFDRQNDGRWITKALYRTLRNKKRSRKRPHCHWRDEIVKIVGTEWRKTAENRAEWKHLAETFIRQ